ncbi:hypothetical protein [Nocardia sp. NPDC048505]|uniref:hypothetical protein n=1 Tax=unclassified Nocardia TaxID=2637762 RepID=UPI0033CB8066
MADFKIGDTVRVVGSTMTGNVGTVVYLDSGTGKYLVRIGGATQNYFTVDELELFTSS